MHLVDMDDAAIRTITLAMADEPGALDRLCTSWLPTVLGWTIRLGGPKVDPEDAAHDVFLVVFRRLSGLERPMAFPAWLYAITRKVVAAHRRRAWIRRWLPGAIPEMADPSADPLRRTEARATADRVWDALESVSANHREVLVLCDLEERADSEVAEMLGIPKPTVKSRLRRARAALRERLPELTDFDLDEALAPSGGPS